MSYIKPFDNNSSPRPLLLGDHEIANWPGPAGIKLSHPDQCTLLFNSSSILMEWREAIAEENSGVIGRDRVSFCASWILGEAVQALYAQDVPYVLRAIDLLALPANALAGGLLRQPLEERITQETHTAHVRSGLLMANAAVTFAHDYSLS